MIALTSVSSCSDNQTQTPPTAERWHTMSYKRLEDGRVQITRISGDYPNDKVSTEYFTPKTQETKSNLPVYYQAAN